MMGTSWAGDVDAVVMVSFDTISVAGSFGIASVVDGLDLSLSLHSCLIIALSGQFFFHLVCPSLVTHCIE